MRRFRLQNSIPGESSCKISSVSGVEGGHFGSMGEVLFKEVSVQFSGLAAWTFITGIKTNPFDPHGNHAMTYQTPTSVSLGDSGPFSSRIQFFAQPSTTNHAFSIEETCTLVIESIQAQPYLEFEKLIICVSAIFLLGESAACYRSRD